MRPDSNTPEPFPAPAYPTNTGPAINELASWVRRHDPDGLRARMAELFARGLLDQYRTRHKSN